MNFSLFVRVCFSIPICLLAGVQAAHADSSGSYPNAMVNGFATVGIASDYDASLGFSRRVNQRTERDQGYSLRTDSRIGMQLNVQFSPQWRIGAQMVWNDPYEQSADTLLKWGYLAFVPQPDLEVRIGRLGRDLYLHSTVLNVGYALTTVRPNHDFYAGFIDSAFDGIDLIWRPNTPAGSWHLQLQAGNSRSLYAEPWGGYPFDTTDTYTLSGGLKRQHWRFHAAWSAARISRGGETTPPPDVRLLIAAGIPDISARMARVAEEANLAGTQLRYASVAAAYDDGQWLAEAEASRFTSDRRTLSGGDAWYVLIGRRFGALTPYLGTGRLVANDPPFEIGGNWAILGPAGPFAQQAINDAFNAARANQRSFTLGARWDFNDRAAIKLQWDRFWIQPLGGALWLTTEAERHQSHQADVLSIAIDMVF